MDGSEQMLTALRHRVGSDISRVDVVRADLNEPLPVSAPVDAIFSVATLHWLPHHFRVFAHMAAALRPGGMLVAECGGQGNIATVSAAVTDVLGADAPAQVWNFAGPDETREKLRAAGFTDLKIELVPDLVTFDSDRVLEQYLETVVLGSHMRLVRRKGAAHFVRAVARRMPRRAIDYVRLQITAEKARGHS